MTAQNRLASLLGFANEIISASFEGGAFEGGDIQDLAVKHGLVTIENREHECGEVCACREYGFPVECYRKTALLLVEPVILEGNLAAVTNFRNSQNLTSQEA